MKNLLTATFYRVGKSTGIKMVFVITTVVAVLYYVCGNMVANGTIGEVNAGSMPWVYWH